MKKITIFLTYKKCKLKQKQMIQIDNSYLEKSGKMHFKILNRLIMYFFNINK